MAGIEMSQEEEIKLIRLLLNEPNNEIEKAKEDVFKRMTFEKVNEIGLGLKVGSTLLTGAMVGGSGKSATWTAGGGGSGGSGVGHHTVTIESGPGGFGGSGAISAGSVGGTTFTIEQFEEMLNKMKEVKMRTGLGKISGAIAELGANKTWSTEDNSSNIGNKMVHTKQPDLPFEYHEDFVEFDLKTHKFKDEEELDNYIFRYSQNQIKRMRPSVEVNTPFNFTHYGESKRLIGMERFRLLWVEKTEKGLFYYLESESSPKGQPLYALPKDFAVKLFGDKMKDYIDAKVSVNRGSSKFSKVREELARRAILERYKHTEIEFGSW